MDRDFSMTRFMIQRIRRTLTPAGAWILPVLCLLPLFCSRRNPDALAVVGNRTLTVSDFTARAAAVERRISLTDNLRLRQEILRKLVDEELLIAEAVRKGYRNDPAGKRERERIAIQELLDADLRRNVSDRIRIGEDELKTAFIRLNTRIKARHLYAASKSEADSLYLELEKGETFESLARRIFKDPRLRDTGGSLGTFTADEMDPVFEDAAFSLNPGQISKPIRTAQGYSILQVEARTVKPLLTESDYAKNRSKLEPYCRRRKIRKAAQANVDSLRRFLDISFNPQVVEELLQRILRRTADRAMLPEEESGFPDDPSFRRRELMRSKLGVWNIKTFRERASFTSEEQSRWIRDRETLEDFIAGLAVRDFMLSRARDQRLDRSAACRKAVERKTDDYLLNRMLREISDGVVIPEDTLRAVFAREYGRTRIPPKIHLREIILNDRSKAERVRRLLSQNAPFERLVREYSIRTWSAAQNGDVGAFSRADLGRWADLIFPLQPGQWTGPLQMDPEQVAFFQCIDKSAERPADFQEVRAEILKGLTPVWRKAAEVTALSSIRLHVPVVTYPEKLNSIRFESVSP
jgi:parvulin-like peptidyl-prolyl isomerase